MTYNEKTKLSVILDDYPWLMEELPKQGGAFTQLKNPAGRMLARRMTLKDASRMSGMSVEALLEELQRFIDAHK